MYKAKFEYLRLNLFLAKDIRHPIDYIKKGEQRQAIRRIFRGVVFDKFEKETISDFTNKLL